LIWYWRKFQNLSKGVHIVFHYDVISKRTNKLTNLQIQSLRFLVNNFFFSINNISLSRKIQRTFWTKGWERGVKNLSNFLVCYARRLRETSCKYYFRTLERKEKKNKKKALRMFFIFFFSTRKQIRNCFVRREKFPFSEEKGGRSYLTYIKFFLPRVEPLFWFLNSSMLFHEFLFRFDFFFSFP